METVIVQQKLCVYNCCDCGAPIALTSEHEGELRRLHKNFYCPSGHHQHFPQETEAERLRKKLNAAEIEKTRLTNMHAAERARAEANEAKLTRLKKRVKNGSCPCCKRNFTNLQRHMASQHPDYVR